MEEKRVFLQLSEKEHTYTASTSYGELLVGEKGYRPMELVLVALAGCMGVVAKSCHFLVKSVKS